MKPRALNLHPGESASVAIGRLHRHLRQIQSDYQPQSRYAAKIQLKNAQRHLRLVKG